MYTVSYNQGYDMPIDTELLESYDGEAREIIFQSFIDDGMISSTVYTIDETTEEDTELEVADFLTPFEIEQLQTIEKYAPESFWDTLTVQTLAEALKIPTGEREVA